MRAKKPYMVLKEQRQNNRMILLWGAEKSVPCIFKNSRIICKRINCEMGLSSKVCKFYKISLPAVFKAAGFTCRINTAHI